MQYLELGNVLKFDSICRSVQLCSGMCENVIDVFALYNGLSTPCICPRIIKETIINKPKQY
jgi:hypothetical protein